MWDANETLKLSVEASLVFSRKWVNFARMGESSQAFEDYFINCCYSQYNGFRDALICNKFKNIDIKKHHTKEEFFIYIAYLM